jgi:F0F1-type ATP synthase assembly protein I
MALDQEKFRADLKKLKDTELRLRASRGGERPAETERDRADKSKALAYSLLGLEFAGIFTAATFGSHMADKKLGTSPWLTLAGIALGFGLALYRLIFVAKKLGG